MGELYRHGSLKSPDVVRSRFGGATALRGQIMDGLNYRSLVVLDPCPSRRSVQHCCASRPTRNVSRGLTSLRPEAIARAYIANALRWPLSEEDMRRLYSILGAVKKARAFWRRSRRSTRSLQQEVEWRYGEFRVPSPFYWGEEDEWIRIAKGRKFASACRRLRFGCSYAKQLVQEMHHEALCGDAAPMVRRWRSMSSDG